MAQAFEVDGETMVPTLLQQQPAARGVLDRYGLRGCGGAAGPGESLRFFARMHGVELSQLLTEVRAALGGGGCSSGATEPAQPARRPVSLAVVDEPTATIYRRFFLAGIVVILSAGAVWGAYLLWKIGFSASFTGVSIHEVNAHGHAQIFGWVGLFIMGFAYQAFPRFWRTTLAAGALAGLTFAAMIVGLVLCTVAIPFPDQGWGPPTALVGGVITSLAATVFALQLIVTFRRSGAAMEPWIAMVLAALGWFVLQSVFSTWHTWNIMTASSREQMLWYLATYQSPLRDLQIHGLALFMILGVSIKMLPVLIETPATPRRTGWTALVLLTAAVVLETLLFIAYRWTDNTRLAAGLMVPWLMIAIAVAMVVLPWRLWRWKRGVRDRSAKFIRTAYLWLAISLVMLLLLPVYQVVSGEPFSHAYYGAIRHAITVGFVSLMIMGIAAKVVPTLNGLDPRMLTGLWGPFVLVNVGCFLRVSLQTLTDWHGVAFYLVGISGVLEVAGLAWWGSHLAAIMWRGKRAERDSAGDDAGAGDSECDRERVRRDRPVRLAGHHYVGDVVRWYPQTIDVLARMGFTPIRSALLRATLARRVTLAQAALLGETPLHAMLDALHKAMGVPLQSDEDHETCAGACGTCADEVDEVSSPHRAERRHQASA